MEFGPWIGQNWFVLLQSLAIIASMLFTGFSLRRDARGRRIANLIDLTAGHRDIWAQQFDRRPQLARFLNPKANVTRKAVTDAERIFVTLIILHLSSVYHALEDALSVTPEGLRQDVKSLFSLPIPNAVWEKIKALQDEEFMKFVDECLTQNAATKLD